MCCHQSPINCHGSASAIAVGNIIPICTQGTGFSVATRNASFTRYAVVLASVWPNDWFVVRTYTVGYKKD